MGRGLARIARILWGKPPCSAGIACPSPRTPRRGAARRGRKCQGATPPFSALVRHGGGHGWKPRWHPFAPPCGEVAPSTVIPGGKAIERCRGQGPINRSVRFPPQAVTDLGSLRGKADQEAFETGCSGMPGSEKVQPARQSSRIQGGSGQRANASPSLLAPSRPRSWEREKGAGGTGDGGARGAHSLGRGFEGAGSPSPVPNV